jgi:type II secretory pathway component GspD/PulD (secretin)
MRVPRKRGVVAEFHQKVMNMRFKFLWTAATVLLAGATVVSAGQQNIPATGANPSMTAEPQIRLHVIGALVDLNETELFMLRSIGRGEAHPSVEGGFASLVDWDKFCNVFRHLQQQLRLETLFSRSVVTTDNQAVRTIVGQNSPYVTASLFSHPGVIPKDANAIRNPDLVLMLEVKPKITPDGTVVLRVVPDLPFTSQSKVEICNHELGTVYNLQALDTTVLVRPGEVAMIGGPVNESENTIAHKVPCLGDLPWVGEAFHYRTHEKQKTQLLIFITPHVEQGACRGSVAPR